MTTRYRRGSTKPLSFFGIKFKTPAARLAQAKPVDENAPHGDTNLPEREPNENASDVERD
ncbi:MAG TPA: hypothetical protein VEP50_19245 [bacterium]|nr:hypothetical protein [bacterium]